MNREDELLIMLQVIENNESFKLFSAWVVGKELADMRERVISELSKIKQQSKVEVKK